MRSDLFAEHLPRCTGVEIVPGAQHAGALENPTCVTEHLIQFSLREKSLLEKDVQRVKEANAAQLATGAPVTSMGAGNKQWLDETMAKVEAIMKDGGLKVANQIEDAIDKVVHGKNKE